MKVIKSTGLVPVKALTRFQNNRSGAVFGVAPDRARAGLAAKELELFPIPDDVETFNVADLIPAAPVEATAPEVTSDVEIPDDWETMQWLKRVKIAKQIIGGDLVQQGEEKPDDAAKRVIREEVQRRADAAGKGN